MKILHIVDIPWFSGITGYALDVSKGLVKRGHKVFFAGIETGLPLKHAKENGFKTVKICSRKNPFIFGSILRLRKLICEEDIDVVNAHTGKGHLLAYLTLLVVPADKKFSIVRTKSDDMHPKRSFLYKKTSKIITASELIRKRYIDIGIDKEKVVTVYQGIQEQKGIEQKSKSINKELEFKRVGIVGRLDSVKGHRYFLEAASEVLRKFPDIRFSVAGLEANIKYSELKLYAGELGIAGSVAFYGYINDVYRFMSKCSVGVIASTGSEAVSRVLLEWMACGKPVAATRVGCIPEILDEKFLAEPCDSRSLSGKILKFLENQEEAGNIGEDNKKIINERFSSERFITETERVYTEAVDRRNDKRRTMDDGRRSGGNSEVNLPASPSSGGRQSAFSKLNILHIVMVKGWWAKAQYGVFLAKALKDKGENVYVLTQSRTDIARKLKELQVPAVLNINLKHSIFFIISFVKLLLFLFKKRINIINVHQTIGFPVIALAARIAGIKIVRTKTDDHPIAEKFLHRFFYKTFIAHTIVSNKNIKDGCLKEIPGLAEKISVIQLGVDIIKFMPLKPAESIYKELGISKNTTAIGIIGRFAPVKGHRYFFEAARLVLEKHRNIKFIVAGKDDLLSRGDLENFAKDAGIFKSVVFLGYRDDLPEIMSICRAGVISSVGSEFVPRVLVEWLACGVPVVATDVGGVPDIIRDDVCGYIVEPEEPAIMAEKISILIENEKKRNEMAEYARQHVVGNYSDSIFAENTLKVYKSL
ncbi:MAG: glycosyltransferase family 4 protein [Elusimicrobia bacterium]|nr:glycosyltransferase family 4 protein [Elusimicrobiota bacterium]